MHGKLGLRLEGERMTQYKRFCDVCRRVTYDWFCCGKRTRRLRLEVTIGEKVSQK